MVYFIGGFSSHCGMVLQGFCSFFDFPALVITPQRIKVLFSKVIRVFLQRPPSLFLRKILSSVR